MGSLNSANIFFQKNYYIIESSSFCRLFFESCPLVRLHGDHVNHSYNRLIINGLLSLRWRSSINKRLSWLISSILLEITSLDQGLYLISELDVLFDIVTIIMMEPIILLPIAAPRRCSHQWRVSQVFYSFDLYKNLCTRIRERSVGVIPIVI